MKHILVTSEGLTRAFKAYGEIEFFYDADAGCYRIHAEGRFIDPNPRIGNIKSYPKLYADFVEFI